MLTTLYLQFLKSAQSHPFLIFADSVDKIENNVDIYNDELKCCTMNADALYELHYEPLQYSCAVCSVHRSYSNGKT